jgi:uncharacterized protein involved in exopolysaccharide biosynthesis
MDRQDSYIEGAANEMGLLDLVAIAIRNWRVIAMSITAAVLLALFVVGLRPHPYVARTVLLPSERGGNPRAVSAQLQIPLALAGASTDQQKVGVVLRSRSLRDSMVVRLARGEGPNWPEGEVREVLAGGIQITSGEGSAITIEVSSQDPELSAAVAGSYPVLVNSIIADLGMQDAAKRQAFLEAQLARAQERLSESERELVQFQQTQELPEVQEQTRRTLSMAAELQQQIMAQEVRVAQLSRTTTPENPELRAASAELNQWRRQLRRLTAGEGPGNEVLLSLRESPELQVQAARVLRAYQRDQEIYSSLMGVLSDAQVDAGNNLPVLSVLDAAEIPAAPQRPPLALFLVISVLLGSVVGYVIAWLRDITRAARTAPEHRQFFSTWDGFREELRGLVRGSWRRQRPAAE